MEDSILKTVKKILGVQDDYTVFDLDILTHINTTFSILHQLGVGPDEGFFVEDNSAEWSDFVQDNSYNMIRSYVCLRVRMLFDRPSSSFLVENMNKQIEELEWRISVHREWMLDPVDPRTRAFNEEVI